MNLHLRYISPCIESGNPIGDYSSKVDMDGEERVRYDRVDIGADEVYPIAGDIDWDEDVDMSDLGFFVEYWLDDCSSPFWCSRRDFDTSGKVDFGDFGYFAQHWLAGK